MLTVQFRIYTLALVINFQPVMTILENLTTNLKSNENRRMMILDLTYTKPIQQANA